MRDLESLGREELIQVILDDQHRLIEQLRSDIEQLKKRGSATPSQNNGRGVDRTDKPSRTGLKSVANQLRWKTMRGQEVPFVNLDRKRHKRKRVDSTGNRSTQPYRLASPSGLVFQRRWIHSH